MKKKPAQSKAAALVIKGGKVLLPDGQQKVLDVAVDAKGLICGVGRGLKAGRTISAAGALVLPGIVDLHSHGLAACNLDDGPLSAYAAACAARGATSVFPTLFASAANIASYLRRHRRETDELRATPVVKGFRLESPYLAYCGGGLNKDLAPVTPATTAMLLEAGGGLIRIWDISPELPGALDAIRDLSGGGVLCSLAHTRATIEQARAGVDAGIRMVTHLFDTFAVPEMTEPGVYPAGVVDYLLVEDRVACEIIPDTLHVPPLNVEKAFRCKTPERLVFVTDSNAAGGLAPGRHKIWDGREVVVGESWNGVRRAEDMALVGSALAPLDLFRNAVRLFGKDVATASAVCSANPARLAGVNAGRIEPGLNADLILLDDKLDLLKTLCAGQVVYERPG